MSDYESVEESCTDDDDATGNLVGVNPTFLPTNNGKKQKLFVNGYSFLEERQHKTKTYWKCSR